VSDAVEAVIDARDANRRWVVDADIKECFDSIDVDRLMHHVGHYVPERIVRQLIGKWLSTQIHNPGWRGRTVAGASQGSVISPLLANLYLHSFDRWITERLPASTLVRFADDFVILSQKRVSAKAALSEAHTALQQLRLKLNDHKTRIVHFDEGFKFLGVFFLRNEHFYLQ
jgi:retron-type reverse transcriptase